jgi:hypothetical protein
MHTLKPNDTRARNAIIMISLVMVMNGISLVSGYMQYGLLTRMSTGGNFTMAEAEANDAREQAIAIVALIALIISAITFIQWFRRAYDNLHKKVEILTYEEGWAAGAWFVPVLNLFRPYQIMKEMYVETRHLLLQKGLIDEQKLSLTPVGWWWGLWIGSRIIGQIVFRISLNETDVDTLLFCTVASMVVDIISIPLGFLAIKVVRDYAAVEPILYELPDENANVPPNGAELSGAI